MNRKLTQLQLDVFNVLVKEDKWMLPSEIQEELNISYGNTIVSLSVLKEFDIISAAINMRSNKRPISFHYCSTAQIPVGFERYRK